jgi:hypothetical protein
VAVAGGTGKAITEERPGPDFPDEIVHARRPSWLEFMHQSGPRAGSRGGGR